MKSLPDPDLTVNPDGPDSDPLAWYAAILDGRTIRIPSPEFDRIRQLLAAYEEVLDDCAIDACLRERATLDRAEDRYPLSFEEMDPEPIDAQDAAWWAAQTQDDDPPTEILPFPQTPVPGPYRTSSTVLTDEDMLAGRIG